jgi:two-component system chemotaxis response regulator CheB
MTPIKVLVVDDSSVVRRIVTEVLGRHPEVTVVGTAANGALALSKLPQLAPDVVVLDLEMPEMDGLTTLTELRKTHPRMPVIIFSTLTERGAVATLDAFARGASDYVTKPTSAGTGTQAQERIEQELLPKIKALGSRATLPLSPTPAIRPAVATGGRVDLIAIGVSTGGPNALAAVIPALPADFPIPIVVVQHMPPVFTKILADRLTAKSAWQVHEAADGMLLEAGHAYIAPGDHHLTVVRAPLSPGRVVVDQAPAENSCRPSVDVLFRSVAASHGAGVLAVVMTGMGQDGLRGAQLLTDAGAEVLAQDEASSVVWGMPGYVARAGLATELVPLDGIANAIERRVRRSPVAAASSAVTGSARVERAR